MLTFYLFFCHRFNNIKVHLEEYLSEMEEKITFNKRNWNHFNFMVVHCLEVSANILEMFLESTFKLTIISCHALCRSHSSLSFPSMDSEAVWNWLLTSFGYVPKCSLEEPRPELIGSSYSLNFRAGAPGGQECPLPDL